jgi:hypothetical protein
MNQLSREPSLQELAKVCAWEEKSALATKTSDDVISKIRKSTDSCFDIVIAKILERRNQHYVKPRDPEFSKQVSAYIIKHTR